MVLLFFKKRRKVVYKFYKWCKKNDVDDKDLVNFVTWLNMNDLLNVEKVEEFVEVKNEENNNRD